MLAVSSVVTPRSSRKRRKSASLAGEANCSSERIEPQITRRELRPLRMHLHARDGAGIRFASISSPPLRSSWRRRALASKPSRFQLCCMCGGSGAVTSMRAAVRRMRHDDPAGVKVQLVLHAAGKIPALLGLEIFRVADDRMADMRGMGAKLVRAAGDRAHRQPGELLRRRSRPPNRARRHGWRRRCRGGRRACGRRRACLPWRATSRCGPASAWARP